MVAGLLGAVGQIIRIDADAVAADQARAGNSGNSIWSRAAASTSPVSMPSRWKIADSSFMKAMLRSRCVFSMTFAASATLIDGARWMPALTTEP